MVNNLPPLAGPVDASGEPEVQEFTKDIAAIVSSYGWLLMRLAVTSDPQDTYDVCKREFDEHQPALKRLQDAFIHRTRAAARPLMVCGYCGSTLHERGDVLHRFDCNRPKPAEGDTDVD